MSCGFNRKKIDPRTPKKKFGKSNIISYAYMFETRLYKRVHTFFYQYLSNINICSTYLIKNSKSKNVPKYNTFSLFLSPYIKKKGVKERYDIIFQDKFVNRQNI